jgi:hypothetical protein
MNSSSAFEFTVRKMLRQNAKLYFWRFTFREVHSTKASMDLLWSSKNSRKRQSTNELT